MVGDLKKIYKTIMDDHFPPAMEISFVDGSKRQTLFYEKVTWTIDGLEKGLRYGENPGQEAALFKLVNGNLVLGETKCVQPGQYLVSDIELLQSGKHPGKTNLTDADNSLNILRYFTDTPTVVIVKHNNPCGVAQDESLERAYVKANMADRVAAFGGCIAVNRSVDLATAEAICQQYAEVVVAPDFETGVMDMFAKKKNLRIIRIGNINRLQTFIGQRVVDFKSLIDGGIVAQWSFVPDMAIKDFQPIPAQCEHKGETYRIKRAPTKRECDDMRFGWLVESGVTSNSVIYVKDKVTVGIGTGEQDRVGVAEIARDKAYRKLADRYCFEKHGISYNELSVNLKKEYIRFKVDKENGVIGDEIFTPDSSRFTTVEDFSQAIHEGRDPIFYDKEPVRIWGRTVETPFGVTGINNLDPENSEHVDFVHSLNVPDNIIEETCQRYHFIFEALTGHSLEDYQRKFMFI